MPISSDSIWIATERKYSLHSDIRQVLRAQPHTSHSSTEPSRELVQRLLPLAASDDIVSGFVSSVSRSRRRGSWALFLKSTHAGLVMGDSLEQTT